jgi:hypothetical protein
MDTLNGVYGCLENEFVEKRRAARKQAIKRMAVRCLSFISTPLKITG